MDTLQVPAPHRQLRLPPLHIPLSPSSSASSAMSSPSTPLFPPPTVPLPPLPNTPSSLTSEDVSILFRQSIPHIQRRKKHVSAMSARNSLASLRPPSPPSVLHPASEMSRLLEDEAETEIELEKLLGGPWPVPPNSTQPTAKLLAGGFSTIVEESEHEHEHESETEKEKSEVKSTKVPLSHLPSPAATPIVPPLTPRPGLKPLMLPRSAPSTLSKASASRTREALAAANEDRVRTREAQHSAQDDRSRHREAPNNEDRSSLPYMAKSSSSRPHIPEPSSSRSPTELSVPSSATSSSSRHPISALSPGTSPMPSPRLPLSHSSSTRSLAHKHSKPLRPELTLATPDATPELPCASPEETESRVSSPDISAILAKTPKPTRRASSKTLSSKRSSGRSSGPRTASKTSFRSSGSTSTYRPSPHEDRMQAAIQNAVDKLAASQEQEGDQGNMSDSSTSSLGLDTPLPVLMLRSGALKPMSSALGLKATEVEQERRRKHRDKKKLRQGVGLTTGLGWSDSEDDSDSAGEDPPPLPVLPHRRSGMGLSRRSSAYSESTTTSASLPTPTASPLASSPFLPNGLQQVKNKPLPALPLSAAGIGPGPSRMPTPKAIRRMASQDSQMSVKTVPLPPPPSAKPRSRTESNTSSISNGSSHLGMGTANSSTTSVNTARGVAPPASKMAAPRSKTPSRSTHAAVPPTSFKADAYKVDAYKSDGGSSLPNRGPSSSSARPALRNMPSSSSMRSATSTGTSRSAIPSLAGSNTSTKSSKSSASTSNGNGPASHAPPAMPKMSVIDAALGVRPPSSKITFISTPPALPAPRQRREHPSTTVEIRSAVSVGQPKKSAFHTNWSPLHDP